MSQKCDFQIARGNTSRYVYIFNSVDNNYRVTKKVLYGNLPYKIISVIIIPKKFLTTYINTVVALTY
jgi:hypothetical protein